MATADIVILVVILLSALIGLARGLFKETLSLATWGAAIGFALLFAPVVGGYVETQIPDVMVRRVAVFAGIFVGTLILGGILQWLVGLLVKSTGLTGTDRLLGFVFGGARGVLVCLIGLMAIRSFAQTEDWWQASVLVPQLLTFEQALLSFLGKSTEWLSTAGFGE